MTAAASTNAEVSNTATASTQQPTSNNNNNSDHSDRSQNQSSLPLTPEEEAAKSQVSEGKKLMLHNWESFVVWEFVNEYNGLFMGNFFCTIFMT